MSLIETYKAGNFNRFAELLEKIHPDSERTQGFTLLEQICLCPTKEDAAKYVEALLSAGANPNKNSNRSLPLAGIVNACLGKRVGDISESVVKIAGLLLEHGAHGTFPPESLKGIRNSPYPGIAKVDELFHVYGLYGDGSASLARSKILQENVKAKIKEKAATRQAEVKMQAEAQRQVEIQKQVEIQRQMQAEVVRQAEIQRQIQLEAERQAETQRQIQAEAEIEIQAEAKRQAETQRQIQAEAEIEIQAEAKRQAETKKEVEIEGQEAILVKNVLAQNELTELNELAIQNVRSLLQNLVESSIVAGKHVQGVVVGVKEGLYDLTGIIREGFAQLKDCDTLIRNAIPKPLWRGVLGVPTDEEVAEANMRVNERWDTIQYVANVITELFNDVVIISAAHLSSSTMGELSAFDFTDIGMLQEAIINNPKLYNEAVLRMNNRGEIIKQTVTDFQQLKSHDQTEVIARLATNLAAPGVFAKAGQSVYINIENILPRLESQNILNTVIGKSVEKVTDAIGVMDHIKNLKEEDKKNQTILDGVNYLKFFFKSIRILQRIRLERA